MNSKSYFRFTSEDHETIDILDSQSSEQKVTKIHRMIRNKTALHNIKERSRTLHEFTLSGISLGELQKNEEFQKIIANIHQLKSLRRLNIDLLWLKACYCRKSLEIFMKSLRHLKGLSTLYFYTSNPNSEIFGPEFSSVLRILRKILNLSKIEIRLSWMIEQRVNPDDLKALEGFSQFRHLTSIHTKFSEMNIAQIPEVFSRLKTSKSLSKFSIALSKWCNCFSDSEFMDFFTSLKEMKSVKSLRIYVSDPHFINGSRLKNLKPIIQEIAQAANLEIVFSGFNGEKGSFTRFDQWRFNRSLTKMNTCYKIGIRFIASFIPSANYLWFLLVVMISYWMCMLKMLPPFVFPVLGTLLIVLFLGDILVYCYSLGSQIPIEEWETGKSLLEKELQNINKNQQKTRVNRL